MSFIYGLSYVFLSAYPIVFQGVYGMNLGVGGLPFFNLVIGQLLAGLYILLIQGQYNKKLIANNNVPIPEWRLLPVMVGAVLLCRWLVLVSLATLRPHKSHKS
jgi:DHA1 family multidrug resistance protein-like MFS transporter